MAEGTHLEREHELKPRLKLEKAAHVTNHHAVTRVMCYSLVPTQGHEEDVP